MLFSAGVSASNFTFAGYQYANAARRHAKQVSGLTYSTWTNICFVEDQSANFGSAVRYTLSGTSPSVVVNVMADILVNHDGDIHVETVSGYYSNLQLRVIMDNAFSTGKVNYALQALLGSPAAQLTTLNVEAFPLNDETIVFDGIANPYPTAGLTTHIHDCGYGRRISGRGDTGDLAGSLAVTGRMGVGTFSTYPDAKLHVNNTTSAYSVLVEDDNRPDTTPFVVTNAGNVGVGLTGPSADLHVRNYTLNGTVIKADGVSGELFTVTDSLVGSLFSVNDISGIPVLEAFSDSTIVMGNYQAPVLITTVKTTKAAALTNSVVYQFSSGTYTSVFFDYNVASGTNARTGTIMAIWNSSGTIEFTETGTMDIGGTGTSAITLDVAYSAGNIQLRCTTAAGGGTWTIKTMVRAL